MAKPEVNSKGNKLPVADDESFSLDEDAALVIGDSKLLDGDVDPNKHDILSIASVGDGQHGTAMYDPARGVIIFTPDADYDGTASFEYTVSDGRGGTDVGLVTLDVKPVNDPPAGTVTIQGTMEEGQTLTATNTLQDPDGTGAVNYEWLRASPEGGWAVVGTGETFDVPEGFAGEKLQLAASYTDGDGTQERVTSASAVVADDNTPPVASGQVSARLGEDTGLVFVSLTSNVTDPDPDTVFSVEDFRYTGNAGFLSGGFDLVGPNNDRLSVNTDHPEFDDIGSGLSRTYNFNYTVSDGDGGEVLNITSITIIGDDIFS
jgi:hypothetical protein